MSASEEEKLEKVALFDESDIMTHQIKLLFANGMGYGLRGLSEHKSLEVSHISKGVLESNNEYAGMPWYGYDDFTDKSHKLSTTNSWVRKHKVIDFIYFDFFNTF